MSPPPQQKIKNQNSFQNPVKIKYTDQFKFTKLGQNQNICMQAFGMLTKSANAQSSVTILIDKIWACH